MKKIGILTGGADCPGLNSVIRAVVRKAMQVGYVVVGIKNGWAGLINYDTKILDNRITSGILDRGGTILGTSRSLTVIEEDSVELIEENFKRSGMDAVIAVGGENTLKIALNLHRTIKLPVVGVPKSIDNALSGTDYAFGFDTAVNVATECIDRLHTTAESHHRIIVIEVMGRYTGWIAVESGIAGGADVTLVPEIPVDIEKVCKHLRDRHKRGKSFSLVVVSEGAKLQGDSSTAADTDEHSGSGEHDAPTNIGDQIGKLINEKTGYECRVSVLGHILRGGTPTAYDRIIGTRFGVKAVDLILDAKFGDMVALKDNKIRSVSIEQAVKKHKAIDKELYDIVKVFSG